MRWEAIAAIAELLGAVGVIVSLVFLAFQVRANTRTLRARASYDANLSWSENNERVALTLFQIDRAGQGSVGEEFLRLWSPESTPDDFPPGDFVPIALLMRGISQRMEAQFWLAQHGLLEETQWEYKAQWFAGAIQFPVIAAWWESELAIGTFSPEFLSALERLAPKAHLAGTAGQAIPGVKRNAT